MPPDIRALFVLRDDADHAGIERLSGSRSGVGVQVVRNAGQAEEAMSSHAVDVVAAVVDDDPMGREVLAHVRRSHPEVARVALVGRSVADTEADAHETLRRPWEMPKLRFGMLSAIYFRGSKDSNELVELISNARRVPSLPEAHSEVQREIYSTDPSIERVAQIVRRDPGMSLQILQFVNSPHFGLKREIGDVADAAALLGINTIANLVLAIGVFSQATVMDRRLVASMWSEALEVSSIARNVARDLGLERSQVEEAQLAGLLHDIGDMILFQNWRERYTGIDLDDRLGSELDTFGATHSDIGAVLCAGWGLRRGVADAVRGHHGPRTAGEVGPSSTTAVHVARAIVDSQGDPEAAPFDRPYLEAIGVSDRIDAWSRMAGVG